MKKNWLVSNLNKKYFLKVGNKVFRCQIGLGGLNNAVKKIEGDKTTPIGKWYLRSLYYRHDRVLRPKFKNKNNQTIKRITKNCGWCDDINSNNYNKYIRVDKFSSKKFSFENLWREDSAYDIILTTSHNLKPTIKNKGSAIFIHCIVKDKKNTAGCVALTKKDLFFLIKNLNKETFINIKK